MEQRRLIDRRDSDTRDVDSSGRKNLNVGAMLIGAIALVWSPIPFWADSSTIAIARWIHESGLDYVWSFYLLIFGTLTIYGAIAPNRRIRFWALTMLAFSFISFSCLGIERLSYNPTTVTAMVLGVFAVGILIRDTNRKPRKCRN